MSNVQLRQKVYDQVALIEKQASAIFGGPVRVEIGYHYYRYNFFNSTAESFTDWLVRRTSFRKSIVGYLSEINPDFVRISQESPVERDYLARPKGGRKIRIEQILSIGLLELKDDSKQD